LISAFGYEGEHGKLYTMFMWVKV